MVVQGHAIPTNMKRRLDIGLEAVTKDVNVHMLNGITKIPNSLTYLRREHLHVARSSDEWASTVNL